MSQRKPRIRRKCRWCQTEFVVKYDSPKRCCGISCANQHKNKYSNPAKDEQARAKISEASKRQGNQHMMTPEARAKAIPKISKSLIGKPNLARRGVPLSEEAKDQISKTLEGQFAGERNPNWKGGVCNRTWKSRQYKLFIKAVWKRANNLCEGCGALKCKNGAKLQVHHIKPWKTAPALRYDPDNGALLCSRCHGRRHRGENWRPL